MAAGEAEARRWPRQFGLHPRMLFDKINEWFTTDGVPLTKTRLPNMPGWREMPSVGVRVA